MPIIETIPHNLDLDVTIDGVSIELWSSFSIQAAVNKSRIVTVTLQGREAIELSRLGGIIEIRAGEGNDIELPLHFKGVIKSVAPQVNSVVLTAFDYVTHLAGSQLILFKDVVNRNSDIKIVGEDLYYAAATVADYKGITVSGLTQGSGILGKKDMSGLYGHKTRKQFLDELFTYMIAYSSGTNYPDFAYYKWYYAIRHGVQMDFFLPDYLNTLSQPIVTLSEKEDNITDITASVNTTRLANSVRVVSSNDDTIFADHEDSHSVDRFGVHSRIIKRSETNKNKLKQLAVDYVNQNRFPTITYTLKPLDVYWVDLGDLVRVHVPSLKIDEMLPVVGYTTSITNNINTTLVLGQAPLTDNQHLDLLVDPQG
tara:strand:+ start:3736 stop:4842 length:1107 start_codon:yes stop_codon:yes gene_type:complete